jgi:hypothetical protein
MGHGDGEEDAMPMMMGEVDHGRNGFNPSEFLTDFDYGKVSTLENGQTLREYDIYVINKEIEIAPGIVFSAWTYNGRIPGPTIRCRPRRARGRVATAGGRAPSLACPGGHPGSAPCLKDSPRAAY